MNHASSYSIDDLVTRTRSLSDRRMQARLDTIRAVRHLEHRVLEALSGTRLRGMPDLDRSASTPFRAIRVRGTIDAPLPDDRNVLVFSEDGLFRIARSDMDEPITHSHPALDGDFVAEDMATIARRVAGALTVHCEQAGKSCARYVAASMLARRISNLL